MNVWFVRFCPQFSGSQSSLLYPAVSLLRSEKAGGFNLAFKKVRNGSHFYLSPHKLVPQSNCSASRFGSFGFSSSTLVWKNESDGVSVGGTRAVCIWSEVKSLLAWKREAGVLIICSRFAGKSENKIIATVQICEGAWGRLEIKFSSTAIWSDSYKGGK